MNTPSIIVNGQPRQAEGIATLAELLESLGMADRPVIIELDGAAILPRQFASTPLKDGSRVEIISIVAGG